jgi:hypothetical protein
MASRHATVIICDEILFSLTGKFNILGNYTADLSIPQNPTQLPQLVFLFLIETDATDPFQSLSLRVAFPDSEPIKHSIPTFANPVTLERPRSTIRWPLLIPQPSLRPGPIEAKVIHEKGELIAATPWVVLASPQPRPVN